MSYLSSVKKKKFDVDPIHAIFISIVLLGARPFFLMIVKVYPGTATCTVLGPGEQFDVFEQFVQGQSLQK